MDAVQVKTIYINNNIKIKGNFLMGGLSKAETLLLTGQCN